MSDALECRCGSTDLIGPFHMDGVVAGQWVPDALWTVCRSCGRSARVAS